MNDDQYYTKIIPIQSWKLSSERFLLHRQQQPNNQPSKIYVSFENLSQKEYIYKHARSIDFFHFLPISKIYIL